MNPEESVMKPSLSIQAHEFLAPKLRRAANELLAVRAGIKGAVSPELYSEAHTAVIAVEHVAMLLEQELIESFAEMSAVEELRDIYHPRPRLHGGEC